MKLHQPCIIFKGNLLKYVFDVAILKRDELVAGTIFSWYKLLIAV